MTIDERIEKLEFLLSGHMEQARKDYEENRRLWREQQADIAAIWKAMDRRFAEVATAQKETDRMLREYAGESNEREKRMDARIEKLVSAIGRLIAKNGKTESE